MGRWAQRSRAGGGLPAINYMISATHYDATSLRITWAAGVTNGSFEVPSFITNGGINDTGSLFEDGGNSLVIGFEDDVAGDTTVTFNGGTLGFRNNQVIPIT